MTLIELLVAMGIFVTVIAVFMSAIVVMTKNTTRAAAVSDATLSARKVLDRFDKQVRYSTAINRPGPGLTTGTFYVEYMMPSQMAGATPVCVQWRYSSTLHTMDRRTWTDSPTPVPSAWGTVATGVRNDLATNPPFAFKRAGAPTVHQELTVTLDIGQGALPGAKVGSAYLARNTSVDTVTNLPNALGQSATTVCQTGVGRP